MRVGREKNGAKETPLDDVIEAFLDNLDKVRGASRNTVSAYRRDLGEFADHMRKKGLQMESADSVRSFMGHLYRRGLARTTMARKISAVKSFYRFMVRQDEK